MHAPTGDPDQRPEPPETVSEVLEKVDDESGPDPGSAEVLDVTEGWDARDAVHTAAHHELPSDLLKVGVARLGGFAWGCGGVGLVWLLLALALHPGSLDHNVFLPRYVGTLLPAIFVSAGVGLLMRTQLRPALLINVGHAYLVVLALLLALLRHSLPWPDSEALRQWALVAVPLVVFAALVPAPPSKILVTASLAAAMDPVAIWLWRTTIPMPPAPQVALLVASPAIAALVSWAVSSATHQLSERIVKAREVGSYKLIERLGVGGMAEVWRARHRMLARPAAVKLIRPKVLLSHGPEESERLIRLFSKEAKATAALSSPHTIQIFDFGTTREGTFYYVMELLDGLDLQSLVELFGAQPAERVAHLLIQICNSLHEAHEANLVHRDVKPGNIFTCRYGIDLDFVKVLDFGLVMDRRPTPEELEDEKRFVGTPSVMAPEMMRHAAPVDARADIYALGCVAYWLLAGKRVFEAQTRNDMLVMHAHQRPLPPSRRGSVEVPPGLEALVLECLEKNPNRRPQSALELSDRIAELRLHLGWTRSRRNGWWLQHRPPRNLREVQR